MDVLNEHNSDVAILIEKKITFFKDILQKIIIHVHKNKKLNIITNNDINICMNIIQTINDSFSSLSSLSSDLLITKIQTINNDISSLIKSYGTDSLDDLLTICFGNTPFINSKMELLKKYFHPISYKIVSQNTSSTIQTSSKTKSKIEQNHTVDVADSIDCLDTPSTEKIFYMKVYGIQIYLFHKILNKNIIIYGFIDDIFMNYITNDFISLQKHNISSHIPIDEKFQLETFKHFTESLSIKDYLIYNYAETYQNYLSHLNQYTLLKQKSLSQLAKEFISSDLFTKRTILFQLLINSFQYDNKYIAYLLYDILSNDVAGAIDTYDQILLYDSFSWNIKQYFKDSMKQIIQYTNDLSNFDINKIPLEQQICLLKTNDSVKEKAMVKLKEFKAKTEDAGSKARQYLDGLLKIPFGYYIKEPILSLMDETKKAFKLCSLSSSTIPVKPTYTNIEIIKYTTQLKLGEIENIKKYINTCNKDVLSKHISEINEYIKLHKMAISPIVCPSKHKSVLKQTILTFINANTTHILELLPSPNKQNIITIQRNFQVITDYIHGVKHTLDKAVHGHTQAKNQIERIVAQWITGEQQGHCFGFEGPPGIGKTSLAKRGLSDCLKDGNGNSRPFAFIQMGGDSNGSTIHGHNYTYVGSTWGSIVQILIDKKCMNPIIFIDELDKISKTDHGREIIGILTHLLDPTQNDCFQDKYFNGIDLDLSKALFVLSYNDVSLVDKTLLDRIHRIKFNNLSVEDKLVILNTHMLPEIYKKMGLENMIHFNESVLRFIIEEYTCEPGVRKLKEILFEIIGDINIDILKNKNYDYDFIIEITIEDIQNKYFKDKHEIIHKKVHSTNTVGIANGMWANSIGQGGVIPVQSKFFPSDKFLDLKLTGLQGDVMKESMNVALTLAWNLTDPLIQSQIIHKYSNIEQKYGIHINTPEGSVQKDGPSAGSCITTVIYSLLNNKKIKCNVALTGEISLDGQITAIGGLDLKILGSIKMGVTEFIYPEENSTLFDKFMEKYKDNKIVEGIKFHSVKHILEVFEIIFE